MDEGASRMTLKKLRAKVDAIDRRVVKLWNDRAVHVRKIGEIKREKCLEIYDRSREEQVIQNVLRMNDGPLDDDFLRRLFQQVLKSFRKWEKDGRFVAVDKLKPPKSVEFVAKPTGYRKKFRVDQRT